MNIPVINKNSKAFNISRSVISSISGIGTGLSIEGLLAAGLCAVFPKSKVIRGILTIGTTIPTALLGAAITRFTEYTVDVFVDSWNAKANEENEPEEESDEQNEPVEITDRERVQNYLNNYCVFQSEDIAMSFIEHINSKTLAPVDSTIPWISALNLYKTYLHDDKANISDKAFIEYGYTNLFGAQVIKKNETWYAIKFPEPCTIEEVVNKYNIKVVVSEED